MTLVMVSLTGTYALPSMTEAITHVRENPGHQVALSLMLSETPGGRGFHVEPGDQPKTDDRNSRLSWTCTSCVDIEYPGCVLCSRDNRNGTHDALEQVGHLNHSYVDPRRVCGHTSEEGCNGHGDF